MTDLVLVSLEPWDDVWRRNQYLVAGLLRADRGLRVLFVEPADDPLHALRSRRKPRFGRHTSPVPGIDRLWIVRPLKALPRRLDRRADDRLAGQIMRAADRLGFRRPRLWINDPGQAVLSRVTGWSTLYDITDDWLAAERSPAETARLRRAEMALLAEADEVVACSPELVRRKTVLRGRERAPISLIRNAVDTAAYRLPATRPADLPHTKTAVYVGTLHSDRLDVDLCERAARALGNTGRVVLVGPNALGSAESERLRRVGVLLLGPRSRAEVVGYLQHADVLVVPHSVTPFTDSLDPIKLYEYLAVNRPIVATPVAGFRDAPDVIVAEPDRFAEAVLAAMNAGARSSAPLGVPDWSDRVDAMQLVLSRMG